MLKKSDRLLMDKDLVPITADEAKRYAIYIPCYNAAKTLPRVFARIPKELIREFAEILVVDNCSEDRTDQVTLQLAKEHNLQNVRVIRNSKNLGYGGSQKVGYGSLSSRPDVDGIIMLHGDAQYAPELVGYLLKPIAEGKLDLIFGSRMTGHPLKGGMPLHRFLGNIFLTTTQNLLLGMRISEYHSGYRAYSTKALRKLTIENLSSDFHFDTEILILLHHHKFRIGEVSIPTHYGDEDNYVNVWKYGMDVLVTTGTYFLHKLGVRHSKRWAFRLDPPLKTGELTLDESAPRQNTTEPAANEANPDFVVTSTKPSFEPTRSV